jgi:glycerol-3-phosphate dehydrogenase
MVPHTQDGRVLFVLPWHEHIVAGTTDTPVDAPTLEPRPFNDEIEFILQTAARYFTRPPQREDILSAFAGLRPLVKGEGKTAALSRDHLIHVDQCGLLSITGGKWTTYRHMAEDCVNRAIRLGGMPSAPCVTETLKVHGYRKDTSALGTLNVYGADAEAIGALARSSPELSARLHPDLPYLAAEIVWAARHEMARTVEDALARHTRALFLNATAASQLASPVAQLLAIELQRNRAWVSAQVHAFCELAESYRGI